MIISILTLFPHMFHGPFNESIIKRASDKHLITINLINIRAFATDSYKSVDDHPYGGGHGMIMRVDIIDKALQSIKNPTHIILLDPRGKTYTQKKTQELSRIGHLVLICGHYEGIDERVRTLVDEEISIGNYVLTGGEIPAMVLIDSTVRLIPGVLPKDTAAREESFSLKPDYLEYPQYTRPATYKNMSVPDTLLSGNHKKIASWKTKMASRRKRIFFGNDGDTIT